MARAPRVGNSRAFSSITFQETSMNGTRRKFFQNAAFLGTGLFGLRGSLRAQNPAEHDHHSATKGAAPPAQHHHRASVPVVTPDVPDLPFETDGAVKVFQLKA